jgi:hypothetical protein
MANVGISAAYFVNAAFFFPLIIAVIRLNVTQAEPDEAGTRALLGEGLRFVRGNPVILTSLTLDFFLSFFGAYRALLAIYARDILDVGPQGFGFLTSAVAVGGIIGSSFVLGVGDTRRKGPIQLTAMMVYTVGVAAFAFSMVFPLSLVITSILGFCDTVAGTMRRSIIQLETPEAFQGRVAGIQAIVGSGGPPLGGAQAGAVASLIGAPAALGIGAVVCGAAALIAAAKARSFKSV